MSQRVAVASRAAAVAGAGVLALALSACGGDGAGDPAGASPHTRTEVADTSSTPSHAGHGHHHSPAGSASPSDGTQSSSGRSSNLLADLAALGEPLHVGGLRVRALDYLEAGYRGAATGTRVDIVTVEECAEAGSVTVQHRTWRLVDAGGRTLGVAGGKMVNGHPTEDLPTTLTSGECLTTKLAIGVPADSAAVAVQDGPDSAWALAG